MNKKHYIGIIGAGTVADFHARAIADIESAEIAGFCDNGSGRAGKLAEKYSSRAYSSYQAMLENETIDIVTIATPSGNHLEPTMMAAEKGKHVLCEKPMEITPARVDEMIEAHRERGTYLGGIFNYRYDPSVSIIREAIAEGRLGKITHASVRVPWWRSESYYAGTWRGTKELDGGGALMNQSIHMIDLIQYLVGPINSLCAYTATLAHDIEVEDAAVAILCFRNGALGHIYGSTASFPGQFRRLDITGTRGTITQIDNRITTWEFAEKKPGDEAILERFGEVTSGGGASDPADIPYINHTRNIEAFLHAIESGRPFEIDGTEAGKAVEIVCAIYESQEKNTQVFL